MPVDERLLIAQDLQILASQHKNRHESRPTREQRAAWVREVVGALRVAACELPATDPAAVAARGVIKRYEGHAKEPLTSEERLAWADQATVVLLEAHRALRSVANPSSAIDLFTAWNEQMREGRRLVTYRLGTASYAPPEPRKPTEAEKNDPRSGWKRGRR